MSAAKETMAQSLSAKLYQIWKAQSDKATQDGKESEDPNVVMKQMADDMAGAISDEVEAYVAKGTITPAGSTGPGGGAVTFVPTIWTLSFT